MTWTGEGAPLRRGDWEVRPVDWAVAERLVTRFHYAAGTSKTAVAVHGLFPRGSFWDQDCRGVAWWLPPTSAVAKSLSPDNPGGVLALSRLAIEPGMPGNSASFLMARSMRLIDRRRWPVFVTYADAWRGHTGAIYRATGWTPDGITAPKAVYTRAGRLVSAKIGPVTRTAGQMIAAGAALVGHFRKHRFVHRLAA